MPLDLEAIKKASPEKRLRIQEELKVKIDDLKNVIAAYDRRIAASVSDNGVRDDVLSIIIGDKNDKVASLREIENDLKIISNFLPVKPDPKNKKKKEGVGGTLMAGSGTVSFRNNNLSNSDSVPTFSMLIEEKKKAAARDEEKKWLAQHKKFEKERKGGANKKAAGLPAEEDNARRLM